MVVSFFLHSIIFIPHQKSWCDHSAGFFMNLWKWALNPPSQSNELTGLTTGSAPCPEAQKLFCEVNYSSEGYWVRTDQPFTAIQHLH